MKVLATHLTLIPAIISIISFIWYLRRRKRDRDDKDASAELLVEENEVFLKDKTNPPSACLQEADNILLETESKQSGNNLNLNARREVFEPSPTVESAINIFNYKLHKENDSFLDELIGAAAVEDVCQSEVERSSENTSLLSEMISIPEPQVPNISLIKSDKSPEKQIERNDNIVGIAEPKIDVDIKNNINNENIESDNDNIIINHDNFHVDYNNKNNIGLKSLIVEETFISSTNESINTSEDQIKSDNNTQICEGFNDKFGSIVKKGSLNLKESLDENEKTKDENISDKNINLTKNYFDEKKQEVEIKDEDKLQNDEKVNIGENKKDDNTKDHIENESRKMKHQEEDETRGSIEEGIEDLCPNIETQHKDLDIKVHPIPNKEVNNVVLATTQCEDKAGNIIDLTKCNDEEEVRSISTSFQFNDGEEFKDYISISSVNDEEEGRFEGDASLEYDDEEKGFGDENHNNQYKSKNSPMQNNNREKGFEEDNSSIKFDNEEGHNNIDDLKSYGETKVTQNNSITYREVVRETFYPEVSLPSSVEVVTEDRVLSETIVVSSEERTKASWCEMYDEEMDEKKKGKKKIKKKKTIKEKNELGPLTDVITKVLSNNDKNQNKIQTHLTSNNPITYKTGKHKRENNKNNESIGNENNEKNKDESNSSSLYQVLRHDQKEAFSAIVPNLKSDFNDNVGGLVLLLLF